MTKPEGGHSGSTIPGSTIPSAAAWKKGRSDSDELERAVEGKAVSGVEGV